MHVPCLVEALIFHFVNLSQEEQFIIHTFSWKLKNFPPHKEILIVFTYYTNVGAVTLVQEYMLTVGLLSWQQAYHFSSYSPIQSFISFVSEYWWGWYGNNCCFVAAKTQENIACYLYIFNLKLIEYTVFILLWVEISVEGIFMVYWRFLQSC